MTLEAAEKLPMRSGRPANRVSWRSRSARSIWPSVSSDERASCASALGLRSPAINAPIMSRPDFPKMSLATTESLIWASSSSFSTRFFSAVRTPTRSARYAEARIMPMLGRRAWLRAVIGVKASA